MFPQRPEKGYFLHPTRFGSGLSALFDADLSGRSVGCFYAKYFI
jgi:hypothetical protein